MFHRTLSTTSSSAAWPASLDRLDRLRRGHAWRCTVLTSSRSRSTCGVVQLERRALRADPNEVRLCSGSGQEDLGVGGLEGWDSGLRQCRA